MYLSQILEQAAQEKAAVESVQREMEDADEANLLEEEGIILKDIYSDT